MKKQAGKCESQFVREISQAFLRKATHSIYYGQSSLEFSTSMHNLPKGLKLLLKPCIVCWKIFKV